MLTTSASACGGVPRHGGHEHAHRGLVIAVSFLTRQPEHVRELSAAFGIVVVAGSAAFTSFSMRAILKEDSSISLRTDGVAFQVGSAETLVLWADRRLGEVG